ncbi:hypothetical protein FJ546_20875 [Mesorhizobium sp. B2-4-19]|nr:hypothetical protein FJ546_20875 [Mesorhizobium sp. B2-4-19]
MSSPALAADDFIEGVYLQSEELRCLSSPALAADDFIEGVYLQSEELCAQARNDTLQTLIDAGNVVLSVHGLP